MLQKKSLRWRSGRNQGRKMRKRRREERGRGETGRKEGGLNYIFVLSKEGNDKVKTKD